MKRDSFLRKLARPFVRRARIAMREFQARRQSPFGATKFEERPPSHANAIDIFTGRWAADLSQFDSNWHGGDAKLLVDPRPGYAALTGPGRVWLQSMSMQHLAHAIAGYLPKAG